MQYDYQAERLCKLVMALDAVRVLPFAREVFVAKPTPFETKALCPMGAILIGYGVSGQIVRAWYYYATDLDLAYPKTAIGRLCCPYSIAQVGRPSLPLRRGKSQAQRPRIFRWLWGRR